MMESGLLGRVLVRVMIYMARVEIGKLLFGRPAAGWVFIPIQEAVGAGVHLNLSLCSESKAKQPGYLQIA